VSNPLPSDLEARYAAVAGRIRRAERACGREPGGTRLLAVSKTHSAAAIRHLAGLGQRAFAESYLQEALAKIAALRDLDLEWHYIGRIQSNKTRDIALHFHWVHSVDRLKIAERLSAQRPAELAPLNICIQVNVGGEATKGGVDPTELPALTTAIASLPSLRLRGLMAIPPASDDDAVQRRHFAALRSARDALARDGLALDTLSMGMSDDLEAAIAEGATMVRIGTALFGPRDYAHTGSRPELGKG
jgi:pyridoxal phosphate enzyme (YggS family)